MNSFLFVISFAILSVLLNYVHSFNESLKHEEKDAQSKSSTMASTTPPAEQKVVPVGEWQPVEGVGYKFYVFSAFIERRTATAIRIIGATLTNYLDNCNDFFCELRLPDNRRIPLYAIIKSIREHHNLNYSAVFVMCQLKNSGVHVNETVGATVAVVAKRAPSLVPTNLLRVIDTIPKPGVENTLHVCVKPFNFKTDPRIDWVIEWIELNRLLGATHFYMYNQSMPHKLSCLIDHYRKEHGIVTLLPWHLPIDDIWISGQSAAFNDCLYRSMSSAKWLMIIDIDEVLIPRLRGVHTLPKMLTKLSDEYHNPKKVPVTFIFKNAFFCLTWRDDAAAPTKLLLTARKTWRACQYNFLLYSKYVVQANRAVEVGNHHNWEVLGGQRGVEEDVALLHHYREDCVNVEFYLPEKYMVDPIAHKYSFELAERLIEERRMNNPCFKNYSDTRNDVRKSQKTKNTLKRISVKAT